MNPDWREEIRINKLGGKREWSDMERMVLCHEMDQEMEKSLESSSKKETPTLKDRWTEDNWREKMAEQPLFAPYVQTDEDKTEMPVNALSEGLAQLKYDPDHNTPLEVAQSYKEDGNHHFKYHKFRLAIASFTEGLKAKCSDDTLNAQLYNNRAAAHFHLENYKSSLTDCEKAIELKPDYMKAIKRGIQCTEKTKAWDKMINFCNKGIVLEPSDEELKEKLKFARTEQENEMVASRKNAAAERKQLRLNKDLVEAIKNRGIEIIPSTNGEEMDKNDPSSIVKHLQPTCRPLMNSQVHLNEANELIWPILFRYPEYMQTDSILGFNENDRFLDQFENMFGVNSPPSPWDSERKYKPENLNIYFWIFSEKKLVAIDSNSTLKNLANNIKFEVQDGTPTFLIIVKGSKFAEKFYKQAGIKV